jgi:hypothetical protein
LRRTHFLIILFTCFSFAVCYSAQAKDRKNAATKKISAESAEKPDRYFDMKIPDGFNLAPVEEPGIFMWKKDSAEIHAVVGDTFADSSDVLFKTLRKGAEANKRIEEVKKLRIKGGSGLLCKEKSPTDPGRLQAWRLTVLTNKKMINVDFSAPGRDFKALVPEFESAIKSFKLKSSS